MNELLDHLRQRAYTMTVYDYEGSEERLETIGGHLAGHGVAVQQLSTDDDGPQNLCVFHRNGEVLGVEYLDDLWPDEDYIERALRGEEAFDTSVLPVDAGTDVAVSPETSRRRLVGISRNIERRALRQESGRLRAGFQHLSRLTGTERTHSVFRRLANAGVDVTVYGTPDADLEGEPFEVVVDEDGVFSDYWFLLYDGGDDPQRRGALVAREDDPSLYDAFWTVDADVVADLFDLAREHYPELIRDDDSA